ncbi:MAG: hypothetical protein PUB87_08795 [Eubacteriaceae bacterium]|nr:hypothetical protein [Eubacteriaceae bacterium]
MNFKQIFFRIYDRKIASGEITFSKSGIKKDDFTRLCTEEGFTLDEETIRHIAVTMKLTEEEKEQLLEAAVK